jgi:hypothetical protein
MIYNSLSNDCFAETCPSNKGLAASSYTADFTSASALDQWKVTAGKVPVGPQGAEFSVAKKGDSPTIDTDFFFGKAEVVMKAAPGTGVVSSIVLESDDLDEIDWVSLLVHFTLLLETLLTKHRKYWAVTPLRSRPTTSVKAIPQPMTEALMCPLPLLRRLSTPTPSTGPRMRSPGLSTARSCVRSRTTMPRVALASLRLLCA